MTDQMENIPALRFPEFEGEWENEKLGNIGDFKGGGTPSKAVSEYWVGDIPWVSSSDIKEGDIHNIDISRFINEKSIKESATKVIPKGSILFVSRVGVGKLAVNKKEVCTSQDFTSLLSKTTNSYFLGYFFLARNNLLIRFSQGTSIKGFTKSDIESLKLHLPSVPEQQKIADFLTTVDEKIQQLSKKYRLLSQYKKGVIEQIFSQQIRFKDDKGQSYPAWEEKRLGEFLSFKTTNSLSRDALKYDSGDVQNIHYGDIHTQFKSNFYLNEERVPYVKNDINLSKISDDCYCQTGDLIVADASEDYKDIGKAIEIIDTNDKKLLAGLHTFLARSDKRFIVVGFMGYLMQTFDVRLQIMKLAQGISVLGISKGNLGKVVVRLPHKEEQKKIANVLTEIDNKIEQINQQLEQAKVFKKGLLQQMFV